MTNEELDQIIASYNNYLSRMSQSLDHFCEDLVDSDYQEISMALPAITDGLTWINDMVNQLMPMGKIREQTAGSFNSLLESITGALENKDYILLNDLCRYELIPLLDDLKVA